jgi:hypothetical protein
MRYRPLLTILIFTIVVLDVGLPASAQSAEPSAAVPGDAQLYVELQLGDEGLARLESLVNTFAPMFAGTPTGPKPEPQTFDLEALANSAIPGVSYSEDIEPWLGDRVGMAMPLDMTMSPPHDVLLVLPAADADQLAASKDTLTASLTSAGTEGDAELYDLDMPGYQVAILPDAVWLGSTDQIEAALALRDGTGDSLADNAAYNRVRDALPADSLVTFYVNGDAAREYVGEESVLSAHRSLELMLRVNPIESEAEDALLAAEWVAGFGAALNATDERIDLTSVATVDASYPAPTLPTETAGAGLLQYIPGSAFVVFDSYDASVPTFGIVGLALLGPAIGNVFDNIVASLENPSLTPAPTPTPPPTPSVDELLQEAQPQISQLEQALGVTLPELFDLMSGEYAIALYTGLEEPLFGSDTNGVTSAIWMQTSDPEAVIGILDTTMETLAAQGAGTTSTAVRRKETIHNVSVITWSDPNQGDVFSYGVLGDDVVFITFGASAEIITSAALGDGTVTQGANWPESLVAENGPGAEALLYIDAAALQSFMPSDPRFEQIENLVGGFDIQADGVFVQHLTITLADS